MKYKQKAYTRKKRKEQIIGQFYIWLGNGDAGSKTMYRIARALDMTPSQRIHGLLQELVNEGKLLVVEGENKGRYTTKFYSITPVFMHYHGEKRRRANVKRTVVINGRLEMWA